jgi:hypothetical protein
MDGLESTCTQPHLEQGVDVVGGVGPIREAAGAKDGERQARVHQRLLAHALGVGVQCCI